MDTKNFTNIPPVHKLKDRLEVLFPAVSPDFITHIIRDEILHYKQARNSHSEKQDLFNHFIHQIQMRLETLLKGSISPLINGTGIVLHTGLGRAPLSKAILAEVMTQAAGYVQLEFDLPTGQRGDRNDHNEFLLNYLCGSEAAIAVNNNAAAVLLMLSALAEGGEVIVSRGQLVEIGGSFRIPDVMKQSGATMIEVGTTNRTHLQDYIKAISPNTKAIFIAHTSNYTIEGFTHLPKLSELVELARKKNIPLIYDVGSGLIDSGLQKLTHESLIKDLMETGVDLISFSGDKLLGGPQAGIIAGKKTYISRLKSYPLLRALRLDKIMLSLLQKTLLSYIDNTKNILSTELLLSSSRDLQKKYETLKALIPNNLHSAFYYQKVETEAGSGSAPGVLFESVAMGFSFPGKPKAKDLAQAFRSEGIIPVIPYIHNETVYIDLRTVLDESLDLLAKKIIQVLSDYQLS